MSNDYFSWPDSADRFAPLDTVRSADANAALDLASAGFEKLPTPAKLAGGYANYAADTGSANAYVVTLSTQVTALADGLSVRFKAVNANSGASTLNVNSLGAVAIVRADGTALLANDILASMIVDVAYNATSSKFQMVNTSILAAAVAAAASASAAATSATNSATSATASATSATASATSASASATSATNSANSATASATSATAAQTAQTAAETAKTGAETAQTAAATSATNSANSATAAATSATNAGNSATAAATSATNAATSETNAANSALTAVNAPGTSGTTPNLLTVGAGTKSMATQAGKAWVVGQTVNIALTSDPANFRMWGPITAYNSSTGAMEVVVPAGAFVGSGSNANWTISLSGNTTGAPLSGTATGAINWNATVTIASAASVAIGAAASNDLIISGTTTITSFDTIAAGASRKVKFTGALTLTHNATSLILPGAASITTANGDTAQFTSLGSGNWKCDWYSKASGAAVVAPVTTRDFGTLGTAAVCQATTGSFFAAVCRLSDTLGIAAWRVAGSTLRVCTLTVSGSTVTPGTVLSVATIVDDPIDIVGLTATQAIVAYSTGADGYVITLDVSGSTITAGTALAMADGRPSGGIGLLKLSSTTAVYASSVGNAYHLTVSGTTITKGAACAVGSAGDFTKLALIDASSFAVVSAVTGACFARLITVSGTTLTSNTATSTGLIADAGNSTNGDVCSISGARVFAYTSGYTKNVGLGAILEKQGSALAGGVRAALPHSTHRHGLRLAAATNGLTAYALVRANQAGEYSVQAFDVTSAPTLIAGKAIPSTPSGAAEGSGDIDVLNATQAIIFYTDPTNSHYPTARVLNLGTAV